MPRLHNPDSISLVTHEIDLNDFYPTESSSEIHHLQILYYVTDFIKTLR